MNAEPLVQCIRMGQDKYGWIVRSQNASADYKYGLFAQTKHLYMLDALYKKRRNFVEELRTYSRRDIHLNGAGEGIIADFNFRTFIIVVRKGYLCHYLAFWDDGRFLEILHAFEYVYSSFDGATMPDKMQQVFAFSREGDRTVVLAVTKWGVFYRTYRTSPPRSKYTLNCIPLVFGESNATKKHAPRMIQLDISSRIKAADYRPYIDTVYIYAEDATYLILNVSGNKGILQKQAVEPIRITDSLLYTSTVYEDTAETIPWQIRHSRLLFPTKDGSQVVFDNRKSTLQFSYRFVAKTVDKRRIHGSECCTRSGYMVDNTHSTDTNEQIRRCQECKKWMTSPCGTSP
ncbi:hypothetical protein Tcan_14019 [Toxocara canis]|uniref:Uncharacterized protein n=1 Tax=Toxocara canis TaxID=6265 RepID=A0A0B2VTD2_TOXCA|nr:hypothetical protein Tcan_14019 [Toxocara canis]